MQNSNVKGKLGKLYGIGAGPGDPGLITLKAKGILARVPIIFVPKKDNDSGSFAGSIIADLTGENHRVIELVFPMLTDNKRLSGYWQAAAEEILGYLQAGKDCAFVTLGDPLLYGSFIYVLKILSTKRHDLEIEVIPGISSISAASASALVPLAINDDRIAIVSGKCDDVFIRKALVDFDTIIFMKINRAFDWLLAMLEDLNMTANSVLIENCTADHQRIVTDLSCLKGQTLSYFSIVIVRKNECLKCIS